MSASQPYKSEKVDLVVQDYMDSLLADLFPDVEPESTGEKPAAKPSITQQNTLQDDASQGQLSAPLPEPTSLPVPAKEIEPVPVQAAISPSTQREVVVSPPSAPGKLETDIEVKPANLPDSSQEMAALKYPNAPSWAQQEFDVLLFDVCGLKLAVSMEALGRIIKVEQELNQLIGRPEWFMGAHTENEQNLYVVDTAKFIMPEKGFDLTQMGFDYIIQLQRSHWTLACKEVYSTVRIQPDQVKWRSTQGKRPWLAGTVIEHMCALIHVDALVELLESEST